MAMELQNIPANKVAIEAQPKIPEQKPEDKKGQNEAEKKNLKLKDGQQFENSKKAAEEKATEGKKSQFVEDGAIFELPKNSEASTKANLETFVKNSKVIPFPQQQGSGKKQADAKTLINWSQTLGNAIKGGLFQTKEQSLPLSQIQQVLLLGWADLKGKAILVGNLMQRTETTPQEIRLALLKVPHARLLAELRNLAPGEKIPMDLLAKLAGSEGQLQFERMAEKNSGLKEALQQREGDPRMDPRFRSDAEQQSKWERSVAARKKTRTFAYYDEENSKKNQENSKEIFANTYELMGLRKRHDESSKVHMLLTYTAITSILAIVMVYLYSVISS